MLLLLTLLACGPTELEARLDALEAGQEDLRANNDALQTRIDELQIRDMTRPGPTTAPTESEVEPEPSTGVRTVEDGVVEIDRNLVRSLDDQDWGRMGRAMFHRGPDGEFDGFRLSAMRRTSLASRAGLLNGDILHAVNGHPLTGMKESMLVYDKVSTADELSLEITRRGEKKTLVIRLVDGIVE